MVEQYPHTCSYGSQGTEDTWDEVNGGWIPGVPGVLIVEPCRASPAGTSNRGGSRKTRGQDGTMVEYAYDLAFPLEVADIPQGQLVTITGKEGGVITEGNLLSFHPGQLHKRGSL